MHRILHLHALALTIGTAAGAAELPPGAESFLEAFASRVSAPTIAETLDMDMSGVPEILLTIEGPCPADGCPVSLLSFDGNAWIEVFSGASPQPASFVSAETGGGLVRMEGITWALMWGHLVPFGDILSTIAARPAMDLDMAVIHGVDFHDDVPRESVQAWTFQATLGGERQTLHAAVTHSIGHMVGHWGTPWFLYTADGTLLASGHTPDQPAIFEDEDGSGLIIVENPPVGYRFIHLDLD